METKGPGHVALTYRLYPQPGYPFTLDLGIRYAVRATDGLTVVLSATNLSLIPAPVALGMLPHLQPPHGGLIDICTLLLPCAPAYSETLGAARLAQNGSRGTPFHFRQSRLIGDICINSAFTDVDTDGDERALVILAYEGDELALWSDASCTWIQVFTGDSLAPNVRRRRIAVEPMTRPRKRPGVRRGPPCGRARRVPLIALGDSSHLASLSPRAQETAQSTSGRL